MRKLILASILLLFSLICIGLVQFTSINMEEHNYVQEQIAFLKDKHIELNVNILRTNLRLNQNYDPLIALQAEIEQAQQNIGTSTISTIFKGHIELLASITHRKFQLLEQFKTDYAILKNAEASLPAIADELLEDARMNTNTKKIINVFVKNTLQYRLIANLTLEQNLRTELDFLTKQQDKIPEALRSRYHLFLTHAKNLINKHKSLLGIFKGLYSSQIFYEIERIQDIFEQHYQKKIHQGRILNYVLVTLIIALLSVLIVIARRMLRTQYSLTRSNAKLNRALSELTEIQDELEKSNYLLSRQNEGIVSSMKYGKRIQEIHLPAQKEMNRVFPNHFIYYYPKDLVSGDFYWLAERDDKLFFAVADATGHGVPGAMLSVMGIRLLDGIVAQYPTSDPSEILRLLDQQMNTVLRQRDTNNKDGMDIAMLVLDRSNRKIHFSGAKNDIYYLTEGQSHRVRGARFSIGGVFDKTKTFHTVTIPVTAAPFTFYLYSDGFQDQFGGTNWRKYGGKHFREFLSSIHEYPILQQDDLIRQEMAKWKGIGTQTDDVLVVGIRLDW
ncbi:MAG: DAHL domain-containing protein [Flammeovirgaceae bacterium]